MAESVVPLFHFIIYRHKGGLEKMFFDLISDRFCELFS